MLRAIVFALVVVCATAAYILDMDRSYPIRDEFDRPIYTMGDKMAFDVRTKTMRNAYNMPVGIIGATPLAYNVPFGMTGALI